MTGVLSEAGSVAGSHELQELLGEVSWPRFFFFFRKWGKVGKTMAIKPYGYGSKLGTPIIGWLILN